MTDRTIAGQVELRARLSSVLQQFNAPLTPATLDILVTHCEVNERHGTGVLIQNIFSAGRDFFSIRSRDLYEGAQTFGARDVCLSHPRSDSDAMAAVLDALGGTLPRRVLSIPYYHDDVLSAIAINTRFGVKLCTYIMDDQNVLTDAIPDASMRALLSQSAMRFGISRELCEAYEAKYGFEFWFLPPVVPPQLVLDRAQPPSAIESTRGVLVGNIWSQRWLDRLRLVTCESGARLDWYGRPRSEWLTFDEAELERDGISLRGYVPQELLSERVRRYPYAVVPIGSSDEAVDRPEFARLSLPSRVPYLTATGNAPIIVLGRADSAAGRFVERLQIGVVSAYDPGSFLAAVDHVCKSEVQSHMRQRAANAARVFSSEGIADWIWASLEKGEPADSRFEELMPRRSRAAAVPSGSPAKAMHHADVVITPNEVTDKHGTGVLVRRIFGQDQNILSIRSFNHYGGDHRFGDVSLCLNQTGLARSDAFRQVANAVHGSTVRRIFCVPYFLEDVLTAIAVKDIYGVPLGTYIMDDQNVRVNRIPDCLMKEFLGKCSFRLATHPELRNAYETKFGFKFWLLPAVVPDHLIDLGWSPVVAATAPMGTAALLGSIWSERWFEMLWQTARGAGVTLDWYGHFEYPWLRDSRDDLKRKGINPHGVVPEARLAERLKTYPYIVVPTGTLDERDDHPELSELSLPGRIIFAMATSNTPIILLGNRRTSAARFIERFHVGVVCDYDSGAFRQAVEHITGAEVQRQMRDAAARVAKSFSDSRISEWMWESLEQGQPRDLRFEQLMPRSARDIVAFIEPPAPDDIYREYVPVHHVMRRLWLQGLRPDFIIDVGASHGIWSHAASTVFPDARFVLIDPLMSRYDRSAVDHHLRKIRRVEVLEIAVSNQVGRASFHVSEDLYGSSLFRPADFRSYDSCEVEVDTLDNIARKMGVEGRGILKLDVQCAEHIVLDGARELLARVDGVVAEISLVRYDSQALVLSEMLELLKGLGYRYYDDTGFWRSPIDGTLLQKEILFLKNDLCVPETSREIAN